MIAPNDVGENVVDTWLWSHLTVRILGLDFEPLPHLVLSDAAQCIVKGQAAVYFLRQQSQGNIWLLKKFTPSRRPSDEYLEAVHQCLPGGIEFFTCTQRRLITPDHVDRRYSAYKAWDLFSWLAGTILMPKVPGSPWSSIADSLREGEASLTLKQRLLAATNLTACIERLEVGGCCHRDLSCSNVFLDTDGRVYLIDWDSLFHASLPFQSNTTTGTMGYIAPFTSGASGRWDASRSWCPNADRYALAILIAEILLTSSDQEHAREDGTMFAQTHLEDRDGRFVQRSIDALWQLDRVVGHLLWKALHASSFEACPSPRQWRSTLRKALRTQQRRTDTARPRSPGNKRVCTSCGGLSWVADAWHAQLQSRGVPFLCRTCRDARRSELDQTHPAVTCEHCQRPTKILRRKLDALRAKGSPVLCSTCLRTQLDEWKREQSAWRCDHPDVCCSQCGEVFRIHQDKRDSLLERGKSLLCSSCLKHEMGRWNLKRELNPAETTYAQRLRRSRPGQNKLGKSQAKHKPVLRITCPPLPSLPCSMRENRVHRVWEIIKDFVQRLFGT
jgi:serine/threonine protein kinase